MTKYGNVFTEYQGVRYASRLEANYAKELDLRKYAEDPKERVDWFLYQVVFYLPVLKGRRVIRHIVDFIFPQGGCLKIVEVKGKETAAGRTKRLWLETHLGQPIEVWRGT